MSNILITGAKGFIGSNLISKLKESNLYNILEFDKNNSIAELEIQVKSASFIVHLAGTNRTDNVSEFQDTNFGLTKAIIDILKSNQLFTPLILASSTQAELDNAYGCSKRNAENLLLNLAKENAHPFYILRLTNVFGKWCKPNYNSVVATFCYNIANNIEIKIDDSEKIVKLIYIDDVVNKICDIINNKQTIHIPFQVTPFYEVTVGKLAELIISFKENRKKCILPDISNEFEKKLYSTFLSYLNKNDFTYDLTRNCDNRGNLTELLKSNKLGQIFISTTKPNITRGNHYHHTKVEKFIVVKGEAQIQFRKIDEEEVISYKVSGNKYQVVDIPPGYAHSISNIGNDELITIFWANEVFNIENPDTIFLQV